MTEHFGQTAAADAFRKTAPCKIKICGLSRKEDIRFANLLHPDYIGFILVQKGHRYITPDRAAQLYEMLDHSISAAGVFINEPLSSLETLLKSPPMDLIQLHGTEDESYLASLRGITDLPLIKAFSLRTGDDIERAMTSTADYILLDGPNAGSGTTFDWSLLSEIKRPYFLAGGLDAQNVRQALTTLRPYAVDVSSGVETGLYKDFNKMQTFIRLVRSFPDAADNTEVIYE